MLRFFTIDENLFKYNGYQSVSKPLWKVYYYIHLIYRSVVYTDELSNRKVALHKN